MKKRNAARLAWGLWTLSMLLSAVQVALIIVARHVRSSAGFGFPGSDSVLTVVFASVGAVVASRRPSNPIGWIFVAFGLESGIQGAGLAYALNGILGPHAPLPGAVIGAWLNTWLWFPAVMLLGTLLFQIFPNGHFLSPRWRRIGWITGILLMSASGALAIMPGPLEHFAHVDNPFAFNSPVVETVAGAGFMVANVAIIVSVASLIVRYRRAGSTEREQIKWLGYAAAVVAVALPLSSFFSTRYKFVDAFVLVAILLVPIAIGVAVLRYRLYDIDRIISRTLSYTFLTGALGGLFALVVLLPTAEIGSGNTPGWLVAVATLVVASLFRPVRRRVQTSVDHRFNRRRYDAALTIDAFASRMRDEVDLHTLREELTDVVVETMHPQHVSLWIKSDG